jgi:hypothetical protein
MHAVLEHPFPDTPFGLNAFLILTRTQTCPTPYRARTRFLRSGGKTLASAEWKRHAETGEIE